MKRRRFGFHHHENLAEPLDGVVFVVVVDGLFEGVQELCGVGEAEAGEGGPARVGELVEERGVAAEEAEDRDSEAEKLLPVGDGLRRQEAGGGALHSVLEKGSGFQIGFFVDDVVEASVLHPLQPHLHYASPLEVVVVVVTEVQHLKGTVFVNERVHVCRETMKVIKILMKP